MCTSPFLKKNEDYQGPWQQRYYAFPCGKCEECQKKIQNDWFVRCKAELSTSLCAFFCTLTYNDLYLPLSDEVLSEGILRKKDLQDFFKRLRHKFVVNKDGKKFFVPIKYLACGEYGGQSGRPHYHFILFIPAGYYSEIREDFIDDVRRFISEAWSTELFAKDGSKLFDSKGKPFRQAFGSVTVDYSNDYRIRYVVKYMLKGIVKDASDIVPTFRLVSNGLGKLGFDSDIMDLDHFHFADDGGYTFGLPRYFRDRVFAKNERLKYQYKLREAERQVSFVEYAQRIKSAKAYKFRNKSNKKL